MIIIVVGMHRSGTSALAGMLHNNGIVMGDDKNFVPKASQENPKGFYENFLFRKINDSIVGRSRYKIKSWNANVPHMKANCVNRYRMRRTLKKYNNKYGKWGWKDPRTCLTLGLWLKEIKKLKLINTCKIIYVIRNPYAVAKSIVTRKNTNYKNALKLWRIYNECALNSIDCYDASTFYLSYEQLCNNKIKIATAMFTFLSHDFSEAIVNKFIDKNLNRSTVGKYCKSAIADVAVNGIGTFYKKLLNRIII
jgi:hypothetical protein